MLSRVTRYTTEILNSVTEVFLDCIRLIKSIFSTKETSDSHHQRRIKR